MEWTDDVIDRLRALWLEGHSTAEIGRRLGISKNAVVGKAHRLSLAARPSPIRRAPPGEVVKRETVRRVTGPTLPPMSAPPPPLLVEPPAPLPMAVTPPEPLPPEPLPPEPAAPVAVLMAAPERPVLRAAPSLRAVGRSSGRLIPCCWPTGEPGTRSFRFCDADSLPGKPYCQAHAALAYVKVRDKREDAA